MAVTPLTGNALSQELIDDAPCGFLSTDLDGKVIYANLALTRWLGYNSETVPDGCTIQDIFAKPSGLYYHAQVVPMLHLQNFVREIACQLAAPDGKQGKSVLMTARIRQARDDAAARIDFVFFDATERLQFEATLRDARSEAEELAAIVKNATIGIVRVNEDGVLKRWNAAAAALLGIADAPPDGSAIDEILKFDEIGERWFQLAKERGNVTGEYHFETNIREDVFLNISVAEIVNTDDPFAPSDYSIMIRDITGRVRDGRRIDLMVRELSHRIKNTLAVVSALVSQSLSGPGLRQERLKLIDRLQNVMVSHDILTSNHWGNVEIGALIKPLRAQLNDPERITAAGPDVVLSPNQFKSMSMAFHELMTNALKYGALSDNCGKVSITWSLDGPEENRFALAWEETGGPPASAPENRGFGTVMIEDILAVEFDGKAEMDFTSAGLRFKFHGTI